MPKRPDKTKEGSGADTCRTARLKAALKANIVRRKAQKKARGEVPQTGDK